jgi:hypothetical protein
VEKQQATVGVNQLPPSYSNRFKGTAKASISVLPDFNNMINGGKAGVSKQHELPDV